MNIVPAEGELPGSRPLDYQQAGPTVLRMLVGTQLRRLREAAKITREDAGYAIRASHSKISRLELGRTSFKYRDVADLLTLYGVTDSADRQAVLDLAERANAPGWWQPYAEVVPTWFEPYLGLEPAAGMIRSYEVQFIPGLLQTADYADAVIRLSHHADPQDHIERRVALRMRRKEILSRSDPPKLWTIIDETALRRPIGGAEILRAQLAHLIELAKMPNVTIQVMMFSSGGHAAAGGPFTLLRFSELELPDVVYMEQLTSALYLDKSTDVTRYWDVLNRLSMQAEEKTKTETIIKRILKEI
jgi:transcriptional regulator with XRE-family HTH domain